MVVTRVALLARKTKTDIGVMDMERWVGDPLAVVQELIGELGIAVPRSMF